MCRYEVVSVSSRQCPWASDPATTHVWRRYTYHLCVDAADRGRRCDNAEATETQNDEVIGSTTLLDCRICVGLGNAAAARDAAIARAEAEYARAEAEAYSETREVRYFSPSLIFVIEKADLKKVATTSGP
jgi:hypothetical protein